MKAIEQFFHVELYRIYYAVQGGSRWRMKSQMKAVEQFIMLQVVQRFNFVDATLACNNSNSGSTLHTCI